MQKTNWVSLFLMSALIIVTSCHSNKKSNSSTRKAQPKSSTSSKAQSKPSSASTTKPAKGESLVDFKNSPTLSDVLEYAASVNKPVFVDMYATWCMPCKLMDEDVFNNKDAADYLNKNFVCYKVDIEKGTGPDLKVVFDAKAYPTLLFLDTKGRVLYRKEGAALYPSDLKKAGNEALTKFKASK